jgi:hypothetical protein
MLHSYVRSMPRRRLALKTPSSPYRSKLLLQEPGAVVGDVNTLFLTGCFVSCIVFYRLRFIIISGAFAAAAAVLNLALTFIPSYVSSVLWLRSGSLASLLDDHFLIYRYAPDQVTIVFGSAFWGALFTGISCWTTVSCVVALATWEVRIFFLVRCLPF